MVFLCFANFRPKSVHYDVICVLSPGQEPQLRRDQCAVLHDRYCCTQLTLEVHFPTARHAANNHRNVYKTRHSPPTPFYSIRRYAVRRTFFAGAFFAACESRQDASGWNESQASISREWSEQGLLKPNHGTSSTQTCLIDT